MGFFTVIEILRIQDFRNITAADIALAARLNVFAGGNGSGKTSLLEAVHVLSRAKSFRAPSLRSVVKQGAAALTVFAQCQSHSKSDQNAQIQHRLGLSFDQRLGKAAKLDGESVRNTSRLAQQLPVIYIGHETLSLLGGAPEERRSYLDWGLFHVEPSFLPLAQRYGRALKQRNAALRQKAPLSEVNAWDGDLVDAGEGLDRLRNLYLTELWPHFTVSLATMSPNFRWGGDISWRYQRGWPEPQSFAECLATSAPSDLAAGFTRSGPHRADFVLTGAGRPLREQVSAGQSKVSVCALLHAQAKLVEQRTGICPVLLVDDLPAELDASHRATVLSTMAALDTQFLVTATEQSLLDLGLLGSADGMFHVEHGLFTR